MADSLFGDIGKTVSNVLNDATGADGTIAAAVAPALQNLGPILEGLQDTQNAMTLLNAEASGMLDVMHNLSQQMMEPHVEMIDETTQTPDGTIVAYADHDVSDHSTDGSQTSHAEDHSGSDIAEG